MSDTVQAFLVLGGACFVAMSIGGSFVFGVATVCRWMEWAPVNIKIYIYCPGSGDDVSGAGESK